MRQRRERVAVSRITTALAFADSSLTSRELPRRSNRSRKRIAELEVDDVSK
jgi:hypothetical protein